MPHRLDKLCKEKFNPLTKSKRNCGDGAFTAATVIHHYQSHRRSRGREVFFFNIYCSTSPPVDLASHLDEKNGIIRRQLHKPPSPGLPKASRFVFPTLTIGEPSKPVYS